MKKAEDRSGLDQLRNRGEEERVPVTYSCFILLIIHLLHLQAIGLDRGRGRSSRGVLVECT